MKWRVCSVHESWYCVCIVSFRELERTTNELMPLSPKSEKRPAPHETGQSLVDYICSRCTLRENTDQVMLRSHLSTLLGAVTGFFFYKLIKSWLDSLIRRGLHQYRTDHRFKSRSLRLKIQRRLFFTWLLKSINWTYYLNFPQFKYVPFIQCLFNTDSACSRTGISTNSLLDKGVWF